jgi:hypothetical protein
VLLLPRLEEEEFLIANERYSQKALEALSRIVKISSYILLKLAKKNGGESKALTFPLSQFRQFISQKNRRNQPEFINN